MRNIKFRGKAKLTKEKPGETVGLMLARRGIPNKIGWVFGSYSDGFILGKAVKSNSEYRVHEWWCSVDPATVGQFTGLKDKNGQEIYEGDIVKATGIMEEAITGEVIWDNNSLLYAVDIGCETIEFFSIIHNAKSVEVVGNVHDNPKIL